MDKSKENLFKAIRVIVNSMPMPFDQTKRGRIIEILSNNRYRVQIADKNYTIKSYFSYSVDETVWVTFPQGRDNPDDLYIRPNR